MRTAVVRIWNLGKRGGEVLSIRYHTPPFSNVRRSRCEEGQRTARQQKLLYQLSRSAVPRRSYQKWCVL